MKLAVLYSGGKDSTLALHRAMRFGEVVCLVTVIPESDESYMFHYPNVALVELQAEAMGIPLVMEGTRGEKEVELADLERAVKRARDEYGAEGLVSGAVRSVYQASRVQRVCRRLDMWSFNPLWANNEEELLREVLRLGIKAIITGVAAYPFTEDYLGREIDEELVADLLRLRDRYGISPVGEGGEFETFVLDAPAFKKRIEVVSYEVTYRNYRGFYIIREARLADK